MAKDKNFRWLENDIDNTLILKIVYEEDNDIKLYGIFNVMDVLELTGDELEIETANIDDLTNLLTLGIVRFVNISDNGDILDISFKNLYRLYENANVLGENNHQKLISSEDLDTFAIIDGKVQKNFFISSALINQASDDLMEVMKIACEFGGYGMQEKFDALSKITVINHKRLVNEEKERMLK